jgi:hypothetical protein
MGWSPAMTNRAFGELSSKQASKGVMFGNRSMGEPSLGCMSTEYMAVPSALIVSEFPSNAESAIGI